MWELVKDMEVTHTVVEEAKILILLHPHPHMSEKETIMVMDHLVDMVVEATTTVTIAIIQDREDMVVVQIHMEGEEATEGMETTMEEEVTITQVEAMVQAQVDMAQLAEELEEETIMAQIQE